MPNSPTVDRQPDNPRACCILCAKWVCHECWDFRRTNASRRAFGGQICAKCGGVEGEFVAVRHKDKGQHHYQPRWFIRPIPPTLPLAEDVDRMYFFMRGPEPMPGHILIAAQKQVLLRELTELGLYISPEILRRLTIDNLTGIRNRARKKVTT